jgi:hypothetical protein
MILMNAHESVIWEYAETLGSGVVEAFKKLLEDKHLYQHIKVELDVPAADLSGVNPEMRMYLESELAKLPGGYWCIRDKAEKMPMQSVGAAISFDSPDVKLFCERCRRIEAFNSVSSLDISERGHYEGSRNSKGDIVQVFGLSFQCQSCKGPPEVFLIRRAGNRLTLSGRAPIEHTEVPPDLPKSICRWYKDATVAHQSGQTLAGLFLLRTLIEQWTRETTKSAADSSADRVLDAYVDDLPLDFKERFPSLRDTYSKLSDDIHRAVGSPDLYEEASNCIREHFEARRLYRLGES